MSKAFTLGQLELEAIKALEYNKPLSVKIKLPDLSEPEVITNPPENIRAKMVYYRNTYNEDGTHKHVPGLAIVGVVDNTLGPFKVGTFGWAVAQLEAGRKIRRGHWHEGDCLYLVKSLTIPSDKLRNEALKHLSDEGQVTTRDHIDRFYAVDSTVKVGWVPTLEDFFSSDWWVLP